MMPATKPFNYEERVRELEAEGLTTSDAQGVADAENIQRHREAVAKLTDDGLIYMHECYGPWPKGMGGPESEGRKMFRKVIGAEMEKRGLTSRSGETH